MSKKEEAANNTKVKEADAGEAAVEQDDAPVVAMRGVSGKDIVSKVKVFKANRKPHQEQAGGEHAGHTADAQAPAEDARPSAGIETLAQTVGTPHTDRSEAAVAEGAGQEKDISREMPDLSAPRSSHGQKAAARPAETGRQHGAAPDSAAAAAETSAHAAESAKDAGKAAESQAQPSAPAHDAGETGAVTAVGDQDKSAVQTSQTSQIPQTEGPAPVSSAVEQSAPVQAPASHQSQAAHKTSSTSASASIQAAGDRINPAPEAGAKSGTAAPTDRGRRAHEAREPHGKAETGGYAAGGREHAPRGRRSDTMSSGDLRTGSRGGSAENTRAADGAKAHASSPAAPTHTPGPRKLGNIFDQMNNRAGKKIENSGLAATAAAFARRQQTGGGHAGTGVFDGGSRRGSYTGGGSGNAGGYAAGGGAYHAGGTSAGPRRSGGSGPGAYRQGRPDAGFDKDKDEDKKPQSRARRQPARRKPAEGLDIFASKSGDSGRRSTGRGTADKNKKRDDFGAKPTATRRRSSSLTGVDFEREAEMLMRRGGRRGRHVEPKRQVIAVLTHVSLPEAITVKEFSEAIKKTSAEVIKALMRFGVMATINEVIDYDTASIIAGEFGIKTEKIVEVTEEDILFDEREDKQDELVARPPVIAVMGHVDHGKTSLLDYIRNSHVATGEAGGITQHIGAYMVKVRDRRITFLDTPGHEAFTTMRMRGAQATDIAILVVAADDGVMPQTIEAISHARAADTTLVVAINKIDKPGADIERVKQELAAQNVLSEDWGGQTVMVPVSAKTGEGIDELLDMLLLTADLMELKANPHRQAKGIVIEAKLDKNRGPLATLLVQRGTLHQGETLVTGHIVGNVRAMTNARDESIQEAGPSVPVEIMGLPEVPEAGELFYAVKDDRTARQLAEKRRTEQREASIHGSSRMSLDNLYLKMAAGEVKDLNIVVKADVVGSAEAIKQALEKLSNEEIRVQVIHAAVGAITESDIRLAEVSDAIVIGFNVRPVGSAADMARDSGVDVRLYRVIYNAIEDIEAAMKGMLEPEFKEQVTGHATIRETFKVSSVGTIGGAYVTDGKINRNSSVRLLRDGVVINEGKLVSLRRFKDDVKEVNSGYECGLSLERFNDLKTGDVVEAYEMKEVERE